MYSEDTGQTPHASNVLISNDHSKSTFVGDKLRGQKTTDKPSTATSGSHFELITTAGEGQAYRIRSSSPGATDGDSTPISTSYPELKFFLWDSALTPYNASAWDTNIPTNNDNNSNGLNRSVALTHTIALGEEQLSARFKFYQISRPNMHLPAPSATTATTAAATAIASTFSPSSSHAMLSSFVSNLFSSHTHTSLAATGSVSTVAWRTLAGDESDSSKDKKEKDKDQETSPTKNRLVSPAQLASDCLFALELTLGDNKHNINDNDNKKNGEQKNGVKDYVERTNLVTRMHLLDGYRDGGRNLLFSAGDTKADTRAGTTATMTTSTSTGTTTIDARAETVVGKAEQKVEVSFLAQMRVMWNAVQDHQSLMLLTSSSSSSTPSLSTSSNVPPVAAVGKHSISSSALSLVEVEDEAEGKGEVPRNEEQGEVWQVARRLATKLIPPIHNVRALCDSVLFMIVCVIDSSTCTPFFKH